MAVNFRIEALPAGPFAHLFSLDEIELAERGARRYVADAKPGFPCRVSLIDAEPGEQLILLRMLQLPRRPCERSRVNPSGDSTGDKDRSEGDSSK